MILMDNESNTNNSHNKNKLNSSISMSDFSEKYLAYQKLQNSKPKKNKKVKIFKNKISFINYVINIKHPFINRRKNYCRKFMRFILPWFQKVDLKNKVN